MKKPIHELSEEEYLEEIRLARLNQPVMTREQFWKQFHAMKASREPAVPPDKPERSGAGSKRMAAV